MSTPRPQRAGLLLGVLVVSASVMILDETILSVAPRDLGVAEDFALAPA